MWTIFPPSSFSVAVFFLVDLFPWTFFPTFYEIKQWIKHSTERATAATRVSVSAASASSE